MFWRPLGLFFCLGGMPMHTLFAHLVSGSPYGRQTRSLGGLVHKQVMLYPVSPFPNPIPVGISQLSTYPHNLSHGEHLRLPRISDRRKKIQTNIIQMTMPSQSLRSHVQNRNRSTIWTSTSCIISCLYQTRIVCLSQPTHSRPRSCVVLALH